MCLLLWVTNISMLFRNPDRPSFCVAEGGRELSRRQTRTFSVIASFLLQQVFLKIFIISVLRFFLTVLYTRVHQLNFFWEYQKSSACICFPGVSGGPKKIFFYPKTKFSWPPKVWYFWKIPESLLVIFSSFLFLSKAQEHTENKKIKIWF